ncbi:MAG TPA: START domain-containing protein [Myxococcaceae bacterium]|nr:START domain-containing protein [Myxococcaceae bacterium]
MGPRAGWAVGTGWVVALALVAGVPGVAVAEEEAGWEVVARGPITVRVREIKGTGAREVWAEGELEAEVQDLESAILDGDAYPRFMPYVKEAKTLEAHPDGSRVVYARLEPPFITPRDYVVRMHIRQRSGPDGHGDFANAWHAANDKLPPKPNVVRLPICDGSWTVTHAGPNRSKVVYRASVDPGAWMPGFLSDLANRSGALGTIHAVEREAQRRAEARKSRAADQAQATNEVGRRSPAERRPAQE